MVEIAKPWKHPDTGVYHLRRQVPAAIRAAFGDRQLYKVSLRTKDAQRATVMFLQANAELEIKFEQARSRLAATGSPLPSARDRAEELIASYFAGGAKMAGGLDGPGRLLLARLQLDRGLWNERHASGGVGFLCHPGPSSSDEWRDLANNSALFKAHGVSKRLLPNLAPGAVWQWHDDAFSPGARERQLTQLVVQVALHSDIHVADLPPEFAAALHDFLNAQPVDTTTARKSRPAASRLRSEMRLMEVFDAWQAKKRPSPQTANEFRSAALAFIDLVGDIPVNEIVNDDLLDFRDEVAKLPASMSRANRQLPFTQQLASIAEASGDRATIGPATIKKKVGGVQALLSFGFGEKWIKANVGRDVPIIGYSKTSAIPRQPFEDEELTRLFSSDLFHKPESWNWKRRTTDCTAYWLFLLAGTTGARIEEVGQALLSDVRAAGEIVYIDINDYVEEPDADDHEASEDASKSVKTAKSRRIIPVHRKVLDLGFVAYCDALRVAGQRRLFPDLLPNKFGKRTQNASRRVNTLIDNLVARDARYVFHSLRHGFRDLAAEADIQERVIDQICGHAPTTVGGRYGRGVRLKVLHRMFHKIAWSFLPWDEMRVATGAIDWTAAAAHHSRRVAR